MIKYLHDRNGNTLSRQVMVSNDDAFDLAAKYLFEMAIKAAESQGLFFQGKEANGNVPTGKIDDRDVNRRGSEQDSLLPPHTMAL
ncbi:MAG TPA: hypothetical protein GXX19_02025 [Syntrophomonadaceae bacterium]|nr:hypothetical protein [Syntrophomonadaceae bacterium]